MVCGNLKIMIFDLRNKYLDSEKKTVFLQAKKNKIGLKRKLAVDTWGFLVT